MGNLHRTERARHGITRRGFVKAAAVSVPAAAAMVSILSGCTNSSKESVDSDPVVVEEDSAVSVTDSYTYVDSSYAATHEWSLPLGNVLHPGEGTWIPVTTAGASASPMVKGSALSLASGKLFEVVPKSITSSSTAVIYDVRCSDSVYAWLELDLVTRDWWLYASSFSDGALTGETKTLWQGTSDYDPAPFACSGTKVIWQVQPSSSGAKTTEKSYCYVWTSGAGDATAAVESPGRFATKPSVSNGYVVVSPRVHADEGVYYGITVYALDDNLVTRVDQLVMPKGVKPFRAAYVGGRFLVSVEANYGSGGLLGQMGTYIGTESGGFVKLDREPSEGGCGKGNVFVIKSRASYFVIDTDAQTYTGISSVDRTVDYGEYPARDGECATFVTFSTVKDATTGYPATVTVRTFSL